MNSLNLAQFDGLGVGHIDHPGTPVQTVGAFVIKILYTINGEKNDIVTDVLSRPEYYLGSINFVFILMTGLSLFILGLASFKKLKNIYCAVLLQFTPFYPSTVYNHYSDVSSESLFIFAILLFIAVMICMSGSKDISGKTALWYAIAFGIICGFGLACKIIFFPLMIIPVILIKRFSYNAVFLAVSVISFLIFVFPALTPENAQKYADWILGIATHSGKYGTGQESVIETTTFTSNLINNITEDISFNIAYLSVAIIFLLGFFRRYAKVIRENKYHNLLTGIFISMTVQIVIVIKQYDPRYMIPAYLLSVTGLLTAGVIAKEIFPVNFRKRWIIYLSVIIILFSGFHFAELLKEYSIYSHKRAETEKLNDFLNERDKQQLLIKSNIMNNKEYCLYFGTNWSGTPRDRYRSLLKNIYPDFFYYDRYVRDFFLTDKKQLKSELAESNKFIYQTDDNSLTKGFINKLKQFTGNENITYKEIYSNDNGETIYEVTLN